MIDVKQKAPQFCLKNQGDTYTCLNEFKGHKVFLYFYPNINDLRCQVHAAHYAMEIDHFQRHNCIVIGISGNTPAELLKESSRLFIPFLLLSDKDGITRKKYGVWNKKITFGKECWITSRCSLLIDEEGQIIRIYKRAHNMNNAKDIIAFLDKRLQKEEWRKLSRRKKEKIKRLNEK